jgi:hypothetical protein
MVDPHRILWALKLPKEINGEGNCEITLVSSAGETGTAGGRQMLQIANKRVRKWIQDAVTCNGVWMLTGTEKIQSLNKMAVPPLALSSLRWP